MKWNPPGFDSLNITADAPLPSLPSFPCSQLFAPNSTSLLGTNPSCSMGHPASPSILRVTAGSGAQLAFQQLWIAPTIRFSTTSPVPSEIAAAELPQASLPPTDTLISATAQGPLAFGSCSSVAIKLLLTTQSQVPRHPDLAPNTTWSFISYSPPVQGSGTAASIDIYQVCNHSLSPQFLTHPHVSVFFTQRHDHPHCISPPFHNGTGFHLRFLEVISLDPKP